MGVAPFQRSHTRREHNRRQAEVFDRVVGFFEQPIPEDIQGRLASIMTEAELEEDQAILDVGTGTGVLLPLILKVRPSRVVACDLSAEMLARAKAQFGDHVTFFRCDVIDIDRELGPFDRVFCNAVFPNFFDPVQALLALQRLLRLNGRVIVSHPMGRDFVKELRRNSPDLELHELPDAEEMDQLAKLAGFHIARFRDEPLLYVAVLERSG
ncbi:MAG: class I SAM-dependent methyltransferase [Chloroflexi bacterium]|nr:class I SAM-dependent methyltransferase [Chloroflexota bacterium]